VGRGTKNEMDNIDKNLEVQDDGCKKADKGANPYHN
jgi:hypothetical protein